MVARAEDVERIRLDGHARLFDSRSYDRYLGQNETIDPVAGHIPGARSAPHQENSAPDGLLLPPEALRERFTRLLDGASPGDSVFYCGSGVSATLNLLAMQHAGLGEGRLYPGSWSEWITDPKRTVATQPD
jgi:thiosulfate/3-mercaptopyruvate sulfurtransferase